MCKKRNYKISIFKKGVSTSLHVDEFVSTTDWGERFDVLVDLLEFFLGQDGLLFIEVLSDSFGAGTGWDWDESCGWVLAVTVPVLDPGQSGLWQCDFLVCRTLFDDLGSDELDDVLVLL